MKLTTLRDRRLTKGVIIGAAGLALLVGGGSYALWFDNEDIPGGTVSSGQLDLELTGAGTAGAGVWHAESCAGTTIPDISTYLISPGDVVCLAQPMNVTVSGDDIAATFSIDTDGILGDTALLGAVTITSSLTPATGFTSSGTNAWTVTPSVTPYATSANVTFTFDVSTDEQIAQLESINLSSIQFSLDQTLND
jgi:alternate signal-mediated exported protein